MSNNLNTNDGLHDPLEGPNKRLAQKGQWQTPPAISFPSTHSTDNTSSMLHTPEFESSSGLGDILLGSLSTQQSSDDIAKALQEAYRRGQEAYRRKAEAAAAAAAAAPRNTSSQLGINPNLNYPAQIPGALSRNKNLQSNPDIASLNIMDSTKVIIPSHSSRPDLQHATSLPRGATLAQPMVADGSRANNLYYPPQQTIRSTAPIYNPMIVGSENNHMKRPILKNSISADKLPQTNLHIGGTSKPSYMPNQGPMIIPSQKIMTHLPIPEMSSTIPGRLQNPFPKPNLVVSGDKRISVPSRSVSLPDISAYAAQNNVEEQKRLKRLERNRASARLRRLKKKNLVRFSFI